MNFVSDDTNFVWRQKLKSFNVCRPTGCFIRKNVSSDRLFHPKECVVRQIVSYNPKFVFRVNRPWVSSWRKVGIRIVATPTSWQNRILTRVNRYIHRKWFHSRLFHNVGLRDEGPRTLDNKLLIITLKTNLYANEFKIEDENGPKWNFSNRLQVSHPALHS
jgi:hypothetical protein